MISRFLRRLSPLLFAAVLVACATAPAPSDDETTDTATPEIGPAPVLIAGTSWQTSNHIAGTEPGSKWEHQLYVKRRPTLYEATEFKGRPAVKAMAKGSNSTLGLALKPVPGALAKQLRFSWFVPALDPSFDLSKKWRRRCGGASDFEF